MDRIAGTIGRGIVAGFVASFVLSVLLDPIAMLTRTVLPSSPAVGWLMHFSIGTVLLGVAFAVLHDRLPGPSWLRGLIFAIGAWLVATVAAVLLIYTRLFAISFDASTMIPALVIHMLYGASLGAIYGWLIDREESPGTRRDKTTGKTLHPVA